MTFDLSRLRNLFGSDEAALRFVDLFKQQLPAQLHDLRAAHEAGDRDSLSMAAHGLKSQCRYLGLDEVADILQKLEDDPAGPGAGRWLEWVETSLPIT